MYIEDIQQAINDYETALRENWDYWTLHKNCMEVGLCKYFREKTSSNFEELWINELDKSPWEAICNTPSNMYNSSFVNYHKALYPRLVFLSTMLKEINHELQSRSKSRSNKKS